MAQEKSEERRSQIVCGAFLALQKHGLAPLSYDLVAGEAGVSRQLVRYYFPDPDDLMVAVSDHLAVAYREALTATAGQLEGPQRVEMFLDFYFDLLDGTPKPRDDQAYDAMMSYATRSRKLRNAMADQYGLLGRVLSLEFQVQFEGIDQRSAEELSFLFVSLMYGHWKMVASLGYDEGHRIVTRRAMMRLIRSYVKNPASTDPDFEIWSKQPG